MSALQQELARVILADPAVESLTSFIGADGVNTTLNSDRISINLKPLDQRHESASDVIRRLQDSVQQVSGIHLNMQPVQNITVDDRVSRTQSFIHPITILSTLPSAGVGALLALIICRQDLSVVAIIGIILLIGIVKKNGIMIVDFALEAERNEGKSSTEAIFEASMLRFRPIMMTTIAALLGGLPLALGTGLGSELRRPLGIAMVGGLLLSQILTLYTTPIIYVFFDRIAQRLTHKRPSGGPARSQRQAETGAV
jgi:multidrug efflux pump subunit AcrB